MKHINIGEAELEIMKVVWKAEEPIGFNGNRKSR